MDKVTFDSVQPHKVELFVFDALRDVFDRRIKRMQEMAHKLGVAPWEVTFGPASWRAVSPNETLKLEGRTVEITGVAPVLNGWQFLAKIEHAAEGNIVKGIAANMDAPLAWSSCAPGCDHCKVARARNITYMIKSTGGDDVRQVGSTCVADFLGRAQREPEQLLGMFSYLSDIQDEFDPDRDNAGLGHSSTYGVPPLEVMAAVLKIVQEDSGYVSAQRAEAIPCLSTAQRVRQAFWIHKPDVVVPDAGHVQLAPQVVDWLKEQRESPTLWLRNIAILAGRECITAKDAGLFASGYVAWNRALQAQPKVGEGMGEWLGSPNEKLTVAATLERHAGYETAFGLKTVLTFRDEEGNALVWKTQSPPGGLVVGGQYHLCCTIKEHGEYLGDKQTEILRVKVPELELFSLGSMASFKRFVAIAAPDVLNESGHTPLLKAVWGDQLAHASLLLEAGADPNFRNQGEIPLIADVKSVPMAQLLLSSGARTTDLNEEWLGELPEDIRSSLATNTKSQSQEQSGNSLLQDSQNSVEHDCVAEGRYSGCIVKLDNAVAVQKINRSGDTVQHALARLTKPIEVGDIVDISYRSGMGQVKGSEQSVGLAQ